MPASEPPPTTAPPPAAPSGRAISLKLIGLFTAVAFWLGETLLHCFAFTPHNFEILPHEAHELWMRTFICALFILFGIHAQRNVRKLEESEQRLAEANRELGAALDKAIDGYLPVCAWCKSIRNQAGNWVQLETYLHDHSHVELTHGICEACETKMTADLKG